MASIWLILQQQTSSVPPPAVVAYVRPEGWLSYFTEDRKHTYKSIMLQVEGIPDKRMHVKVEFTDGVSTNSKGDLFSINYTRDDAVEQIQELWLDYALAKDENVEDVPQNMTRLTVESELTPNLHWTFEIVEVRIPITWFILFGKTFDIPSEK